MLAAAREDLAASLQELRELAQGIHPAVLSDHGLGGRARVAARLGRRCPCELSVEVEGRLPDGVEVAAYYLVCEALTNVAKYAQRVVRERRGHARRTGS